MATSYTDDDRTGGSAELRDSGDGTMKCPTCGQNKPNVKTEERFTGEFRYGLQPKPGSPREPVKNYEEVATIDTICNRWRQGDSLRAIVRWLDGIGVRNRRGGTWHHQSVKRILRREGLI